MRPSFFHKKFLPGKPTSFNIPLPFVFEVSYCRSKKKKRDLVTLNTKQWSKYYRPGTHVGKGVVGPNLSVSVREALTKAAEHQCLIAGHCS